MGPLHRFVVAQHHQGGVRAEVVVGIPGSVVVLDTGDRGGEHGAQGEIATQVPPHRVLGLLAHEVVVVLEGFRVPDIPGNLRERRVPRSIARHRTPLPPRNARVGGDFGTDSGEEFVVDFSHVGIDVTGVRIALAGIGAQHLPKPRVLVDLSAVDLQQPVHLDFGGLVAKLGACSPTPAVVHFAGKTGGHRVVDVIGIDDVGPRPHACLVTGFGGGNGQTSAAVLHDGIPLREAEGKTGGENVRHQGKRDRTLEVDEVEVPVVGAEKALETPIRLDGIALDGSRRGVSIVPVALGPAQHLYGLDVEELAELERRGVDGNVIHVDGHRARGIRVEVVETHASNEEGGRGGSQRVDLEVGRDARQVRDVRGPQRSELCRTELGGGCRRVVRDARVRLPLDDDLLDVAGGIVLGSARIPRDLGVHTERFPLSTLLGLEGRGAEQQKPQECSEKNPPGAREADLARHLGPFDHAAILPRGPSRSAHPTLMSRTVSNG